jgi:hypothetical protein
MINMFDSLSLDEDWLVESEHGFSVKFLRFGGELRWGRTAFVRRFVEKEKVLWVE